MREIADAVVTLFLVGIAYKDWKTKRISVMWLAVLGIGVCAVQLYLKETGIWSILGASLIGAGFLLAGRCTKEAVGYGDGWLITILGIYLGAERLLEVLLSAGVGASLFALWRLSRCNWSRRLSIPFAPFLAAAYIGAVYL